MMYGAINYITVIVRDAAWSEYITSNCGISVSDSNLLFILNHEQDFEMGITISHTNYAPISLVLTLIGFVSFAFSLGTFIKVF
jgi:hypothetical protein